MYKINSKLTTDLNVKGKTINSQEKKIENFCEFGLGKDFLEYKETQAIQEKKKIKWKD